MIEIQTLLETSDILKQKVVYLAGFLVHKYNEPNVNEEEEISCEFISELNRGGLHVPTLSTIYFVHSAISLHNKTTLDKIVVNISRNSYLSLMLHWHKMIGLVNL